VRSWTLSGPFTRQSVAERAAVAVLATHTCVGAQVLTREQLDALVGDHDTPYEITRIVRPALRLQVEPASS